MIGIFNQYLILDDRRPNSLFGTPGCGMKNCFEKILCDYNMFFNKSLNFGDVIKKNVNLCCSFLVKKEVFEQLTSFIYCIINSGVLNKFDTEHRYRLQGQITERYISLFSSQYNIEDLTLKHNFIGGKDHQYINSY
jgi:hypothetical protein